MSLFHPQASQSIFTQALENSMSFFQLADLTICLRVRTVFYALN